MPLSQPRTPSLGSAVADLGLGDLLGQQVQGETEEMRKKRMLEMQQRGLMPPGAMGSAASLALFGGMGGLGA